MTAPVKPPITEARFVANLILKERAKQLITDAMHPSMRWLQVARELEDLITVNPKVALCTERSLVRGLAMGVSYGLRLGVTWHLVPQFVKVVDLNGTERKEWRARCQLDYKGEMRLMRRRRDVIKRVDAHCVYENEEFKCRLGTDPMLEHWPILRVMDRGDLHGGYAIVEWQSGGFAIEMMDAVETNVIRQRCSKNWIKDQNNNPIPIEQIPWYVKKTCVHRLANQIELDGTRDEQDAAPIVYADQDAVAMAAFAEISDAPILNSAEARKMLGAGPVATVHHDRHRDGVPVSHPPIQPPHDDPYGLGAMQEAQVG